MSQIDPSTPPSNLSEGLSIIRLRLLLILLIPCVVLLLLFNCLFLGYKLHMFSKKNRKRQDNESILQSTLSMRQRMAIISVAPFVPNQDGKGGYISVSEPILAQALSSPRSSSNDKAAVEQSIRFVRLVGATDDGGSESLGAPSAIFATTADTNSRIEQPRRSSVYSRNKIGWRRSAPVLPQSSDSEAELPNLVPPNSPALNDTHSRVTPDQRHMRRCSTMELQYVLNNTEEHKFDMVEFECEYASSIPPETSCFVASDNSSTMGPGLDSDFGASAGVSLRILSADSDGLTNRMWASGMDWDYYDPCYVSERHIPKQKDHKPALHTKHYWV
ncbi:protein huluwa-like [Oncorhynchus keta]|uniref:protein huluwa-like n=1 Tax=Oncorhynchus keta TaxID=8018 RepID=UPI0015FBA6EF|nr:protein huluwa-like [Oncorhynchus keta]